MNVIKKYCTFAHEQKFNTTECNALIKNDSKNIISNNFSNERIKRRLITRLPSRAHFERKIKKNPYKMKERIACGFTYTFPAIKANRIKNEKRISVIK